MHSLFEPFFFLTNTIDEAKRLCDSWTIPASSSSLRCCFTASLSVGCMGLSHSLKCFSLFNLIWCSTAVVWPCDMSSRTKISGMDLIFSRIRSGMGESSRLDAWLSLFGSFPAAQAAPVPNSCSNCWELDSLPGPLILTWYKKNDSRQNAYSINSWYTVYAGDVHSTKAICRSEGQSLDLLHLYCFQTSSVSICLSYVVSTLCCLPHYSCTVSIRTPPYTVICLNFIFYFPAHALTYYLCGWPLHELSMHLKLHCLVLLCNLRWVISLSILIQMC